MKKLLPAFLLVLLVFSMSSCATIFGGHIDNCQINSPGYGQPGRKIRPVALIGDIIIIPGLIVDFADCAIYKPCKGY
jgi:hypothetical protein